MKKYLFFINLFFAFCLNAQQSLQWNWLKNFNGNLSSYSHYLAADYSGNFYLNTLDKGMASVIKFDKQGNQLWKKYLPSIAIQDIAASNNFFYITGSFYDSVLIENKRLTSNGGADIFLACFSSSGNFIWAKNFGGREDDAGNALCCDKSENVYLTGNYSDTAYFENTSIICQGNTNMFIVKFSSAGNLSLLKSAGSKPSSCYPSGLSYGRGIQVDTFGNIYVMGTFTQLLLDTFYIEDCSEYYNIYAIPGYLCKLLPDGNVKWLKEVNKCNEQMKDMSLTGNIIYEAGEVYSWHDRGGLMKSFDASTGQEISSGGNGGCFEWCDASMNAVAADVLSPFTIGYASDDSPPSYPNLHYLYLNNNISCHENIYSSDIVHLSTGGFIICGRIDSSLILGKDSINAANGNVFVAKFNDPDPIPTNSISDNIVSETINIFPNPSYGKFTIESSEKKFVVEITSLTGKKIYFTKISTEKLEIDLSNQPKGIYFLEAMIGEERKIKKIIIE